MKLQFFCPFFSSIEEVTATLVMINISNILNDTTKIFTFSKMGVNIIKFHVEGKKFQ